MDRLTYSKPNFDKYDMNINLYSKFKSENIKLYENDRGYYPYLNQFYYFLNFCHNC